MSNRPEPTVALAKADKKILRTVLDALSQANAEINDATTPASFGFVNFTGQKGRVDERWKSRTSIRFREKLGLELHEYLNIPIVKIVARIKRRNTIKSV